MYSTYIHTHTLRLPGMVVIIWRHFQHEELVRPGIEPRVRRVQRRHVLAVRPPEVAAVVRILVLDPAGAVSYTYSTHIHI